MQVTKLFSAKFRFMMLWRVAEILLLTGLVVVVTYVQQLAHEYHYTYAAAREAQNRRPETEAQLTATLQQLATATPQLAAVMALLPPRDDIGEYLSWLEQRAAKYHVQLQITNVQADTPPEATEGEPSPPVVISSGYAVVRISITGNGETSSLFEFLHDIEHGPYVAAVPSWTLRPSVQAGAGGMAVPRGIGTPPGVDIEDTRPQNHLTAEIIQLVTSL